MGLSTGCELDSGGGRLGVTALACCGTGLLGGGGLGAGGFGFGGCAGLGGAFLGLIFFIFGVAAAWAFCLANSLACAATADQTLSDIKRQSAS